MNNPICSLLGIQYPILQGGMGNISDPLLAAAVSNAGGLGTIGVGTLPISKVKEMIDQMLVATSAPCCVNIPLSVHPAAVEVIEEVIAAKVPVVSLSAGNPTGYIRRFHEQGVKVICVTATVRQAKKAAAAGADIIVCEGYEAAGINAPSESTTMTLVPQIAKAVSTPVVAAGGVGDGKGLAAAIALGACGVQIGTRLIATQEAPYHPRYKQAILDATDESTVIVGRPYKKIRRVLKNDYAEKLLKRDPQQTDPETFAQETSEDHHRRGAVEGDFATGFINGGQIAGLIDHCPSVSELFQEMLRDAKAALHVGLSMLQ
ncbi:NAD(P)H-dependent flavin oxidoreductase [Camelliibacillus cellulosilyticus]|uniref:Probable nitronate monooxygenase n=1 Tax=Camelliibacillus cellulosilyticus TaxID=2174486 RepID=A0ABV9GPM2_9BACL